MVARRSNDYCRLWVSKDFQKMMKLKATQEGKSIFEYSKELSRKQEEEQKKNGFKLGF